MPLTRVHYRYTDAGNYKYDDTVLLFGKVTDTDRARLHEALDKGIGSDGNGFIPQQLGWRHPAAADPAFPSSDDHCWSTLDVNDEETFEEVEQPEPGEVIVDSVSGWVEAMATAGRRGWDSERWAL